MAEPNQQEPPTTEDPPVIDFELLSKIITVNKDGQKITLDAHLTEKITEACAAAKYHGKEAVVTLTLKFKPGSGYTMDVFPDVTAKVPTDKPTPIPMFANEEGTLFTDDPAQRPLKNTTQFRTVRKDGNRK